MSPQPELTLPDKRAPFTCNIFSNIFSLLHIALSSDVVLETKVLVSRRLEDKQ